MASRQSRLRGWSLRNRSNSKSRHSKAYRGGPPRSPAASKPNQNAAGEMKARGEYRPEKGFGKGANESEGSCCGSLLAGVGRCCKDFCKLITCQGPGPDPVYNDNAIYAANDTKYLEKEDGKSSGQRIKQNENIMAESWWKSSLERLDILTALKPFDIVYHYFQPYSTGLSLAYLLFSILIIFTYAYTVFSRENSLNYRTTFAAGITPFNVPDPFGLELIDPNGFNANRLVDVTWYLETRKVIKNGTSTLIEISRDNITGPANVDVGFVDSMGMNIRSTCILTSDPGFNRTLCPEAGRASLKSNAAKAFSVDGEWQEVVAEVRLSNSTNLADIYQQYVNSSIIVRLQRLNPTEELFGIFTETNSGVEIIRIPNLRGQGIETNAFYAEMEFLQESRVVLGGGSNTAIFYRQFYQTAYPLPSETVTSDTVLFTLRLQLEDIRFQTQRVNGNQIENVGFICGVGVIIFVAGAIFRAYNRWHFNQYGKFNEGNIDPVYLRNFLRRDPNYTPPGIAELQQENLTESRSAERRLDNTLQLAADLRESLQTVIEKKKEFSEAVQQIRESMVRESRMTPTDNRWGSFSRSKPTTPQGGRGLAPLKEE